jgi:hypothetical protein
MIELTTKTGTAETSVEIAVELLGRGIGWLPSTESRNIGTARSGVRSP